MEIRSFKLESSREYRQFEDSPVAFFCAEYAFDDSSTFAGGLGILASDFILQASDDGLPLIALGVWYGGPKDEGQLREYSILTDNGNRVVIDVPCGAENIKTNVWVRRFGKTVTLFLLDTNNEENSPENQAVTNRLYDSNLHYRLQQEVVLGIGGVRLLDKLKIKPKVYHLNEGHTAFAALELVIQEIRAGRAENLKGALNNVKKNIVATKHTIFSVAGEVITKDHLEVLLGHYVNTAGASIDDIFKLGENKNNPETFSTTQLMLSCAERQNGVSRLHTITEKVPHPTSILFPITNGVYDKRWQADFWRLADYGDIPDKTIWEMKQKLRERLVNFVKEKTGANFDPEVCTIVWARRFTPYKRPELIFSDLKRLEEICSAVNRAQFIISGKAHVLDIEGLKSVERIKALAKDSAFKNKLIYIEDYSISVATELVSGADIWLNTPERGFEACGTSGMKAGLNGAIQVSVSDGWIDEVNWTDTGFILPTENTAHALYGILKNEILPMFYKKDENGLPTDWIKRARLTRNIVKSNFTAKRMLKDYITKTYLAQN